VADPKDPHDPNPTEAPPQTQPAEEWGQREDDARTIASGGKENEKAEAKREQRP
jgi:hypothetical protein